MNIDQPAEYSADCEYLELLFWFFGIYIYAYLHIFTYVWLFVSVVDRAYPVPK